MCVWYKLFPVSVSVCVCVCVCVCARVCFVVFCCDMFVCVLLLFYSFFFVFVCVFCFICLLTLLIICVVVCFVIYLFCKLMYANPIPVISCVPTL